MMMSAAVKASPAKKGASPSRCSTMSKARMARAPKARPRSVSVLSVMVRIRSINALGIIEPLAKWNQNR